MAPIGFLFLLTAPLTVASLACGGSQPEPIMPRPVTSAPTVAPPVGTGTAPPVGTGPAVGTGPVVAAGTAGTATPVDPNMAQLASAPLALLARTEAPSSAAAAAPMVATFQEGQTMEQAITISPGKCYTFVAAGGGPQEIEIALVGVTPVPGFAPPMGSTKGPGLRTILGAKDTCIKLAIIPVDVPAKWIVKATKGGGVIAAQAYVR